MVGICPTLGLRLRFHPIGDASDKAARFALKSFEAVFIGVEIVDLYLRDPGVHRCFRDGRRDL